jgi:hypothetical protein
MPKISQLPSATTLGLTDVIPVVQSGVTYQVAAGNLNTATPYGSFYYTGSQTFGVASGSVSMSTTAFSSNITLDATQTKLTVGNSGKYLVNIQTIPSGAATANGIKFFLAVNGAPVANTGVLTTPQTNTAPSASCDFTRIVNMTSGQTLEIIGSGSSATHGITTTAAVGAVPAIPAMSVMIHQVN